jgi:cell division protein FtsZ
MGHAVMGTAVRSGENRAMEAAQAAMASPLLEAGAIDGARGILINITGSSSLKLSEVNAASSLIQSAAHEDANIIFGAVQDEKMGDEVKITVIATGFRDQMPERRARMLSVEEAPVVSVPLASVPLIAPGNWMQESAAPVPTLDPAPVPARFLSQDEEPEEETAEVDEPAFFAASAAAAASLPRRPAQPAQTAVEADPTYGHAELELVAAPARPRFAKMSEEPAYTLLPRDYASDFDSGVRGPVAVGEPQAQPTAALFSEADEEAQRDLDTPAFLRRLRF